MERQPRCAGCKENVQDSRRIRIFHRQLGYYPPLKATLTGTATGPMLVQHLVGSGTDVDMAVTTQTFLTLRQNSHIPSGFSRG